MMRRLRAAHGFTFVEIVVATALMFILAGAALPLARVSIKREREAELRRDLRDMRTAIDKFKDDADRGVISTIDLGPTSDHYPPDLQTLVDGVQLANTMQQDMKRKFLRRIPIDPMTGAADWGMRSVQDTPDSTSWGGGNVFDVYSKSQDTALDGTKYKDW